MTTFVKAAQEIVKSIDPSSPAMNETKELLSTLEELGNTKQALFEEKITLAQQNAGIGSDKTLPVASLDNRTSGMHAYVSADAEHIANTISETIKSLLKTIQSGSSWDKIASAGLDIGTTAVNTLVTGLLGGSDGTVGGSDHYLIFTNGISLKRVDFLVWKRSIQTKGIMNRCEQILAFAGYSSIVDLPKVDKSTFRDKFQYTVMKSYPDIAEDPIKIIDKCDELFNKIQENNSMTTGVKAAANVQLVGPDD